MANIVENNELIARFMECEFKKNGVNDKFFYINGIGWSDRLEYDKSWDWLMPVVEKIEGIGYETYICHDPKYGGDYINICPEDGNKNIFPFKDDTHGIDTAILSATGSNKIISVYAAVLQFIDWYNSQPKN